MIVLPHFARAFILAILTLNASGALAFVVTEPCSVVEAAQDPDGQCAPTCARCGCCARPAVPMPFEVIAAIDLATSTTAPTVLDVPPFSGRDILHVPKL